MGIPVCVTKMPSADLQTEVETETLGRVQPHQAESQLPTKLPPALAPQFRLRNLTPQILRGFFWYRTMEKTD